MEAKEHHVHPDEDETPNWKGPLRIILGLFLLFLIVLWLVPYYGLKLNPEPRDIPSLSRIQSQFIDGIDIGNETGTDDIKLAEKEYIGINPVIKQVATSIATSSCDESRSCYAKALYYFVRDNIEYVSDPNGIEYIASPIETLKTGGGDCDDGAILLSALVNAVGIATEVVVVPGHALTRTLIPEAPDSYKSDNGWIYMDWTCSQCRFAEVNYQNVLQLGG